MRILTTGSCAVFYLLLAAVHPAFGQTSLNLSEDLVQFGIASSNMVPNQPTRDAGPLLLAGVDYAQANNIPLVIADSGAYYFLSLQTPNVHVVFGSLSNLTIDFQGSDLYFSHMPAYGIYISSARNLTLQNFTLDYQPLPFTQVQVVSVDPDLRQVQYKLLPGWQDPSAFNPAFASTGGSFIVPIEFYRSGARAPNLFSDLNAVLPIGGSQFTIAPDQFGYATNSVLAQIRPGDVAVLSIRAGRTPLRVNQCNNCTIRNVTAYSSTEDGVQVESLSSTTLERVSSIPRPGTDRLVSVPGSAMTLIINGPNNVVRLGRGIRTGDDSFTIVAPPLGTVQSQLNGTNLTACVEGISVSYALPNGTPVNFEDLTGVIVANAVIVSQTAPPNPTFTFDRVLPASVVGTQINSADSSFLGSGTLLERNASEEKGPRSNGAAINGLANTVFSGNYMQRSATGGVSVNPGFPPSANLTIENNVIDTANFWYTFGGGGGIVVEGTFWNGGGCLAGGVRMTASPFQNIDISGNFVADPGVSAVAVANTTGGSVAGNYYLDPNNNPQPGMSGPFNPDIDKPLAIEYSSNIAANNNIIDQTSGRMWVTDTQYNELAAYAPGSTYRLNAYNLGTLATPAIMLTDGDGNTTPVTIQKTSAHSFDVLIPASAGLGGAYFTLTSGSMKYFGTLFLDSQDNIPALNGCTYETSLSSASVPAAASSLPILVVTQAGCSYQVLNTASLAGLGPVTTGTAVVSVAFPANAGASQTTTIEIAGQQIAITQAALTPAIQAIQDSLNYTSGIAPGAWVAIFGTDFASGPPQTWNVTGSQLPTTLNGVTVTFNGMDAALLYVSSTQINALVPAGIAPGPVQVIVQSNGTSSSPFTTTATATLPAIYALPNTDGSAFYVTAALEGTGLLVGTSAVDSRVLRGAQPGDILDLYMIGLGATADPSQFITDRNFAGAYPIAASLSATIGSEQAPVLFAGLTTPGLYLVRITVPSDLAPGPSPIRISVGGALTLSSLFLIIGAAPQGNLVQDGSFESPLAGTWNLDCCQNGAASIVQVTNTAATDGNESAEISVTSTGNPTIYSNTQFWQGGLALQQGHVYVLKFSAMADSGRTMHLGVTQNGGSYQHYGLSTAVGLGENWQEYILYFQSTATDPASRLTFYFGDQIGNSWLGAVVLQDTTP
jgi:uncharacterized protein (TIGR03437 family)